MNTPTCPLAEQIYQSMHVKGFDSGDRVVCACKLLPEYNIFLASDMPLHIFN